MEFPFCALVLTILGVCWMETDGNSVTLTPSPNATVNEGDTLALHCDYNGSYTLITVNWYLNHNPLCLEVFPSSCDYYSIPPEYEISRYNKYCSNNRFSLFITNVTKDKDHNHTWECDTTLLGSFPPTKVLTTIKVTDTKTHSLQTIGDCAHESFQRLALVMGFIICVICNIFIVILVKSVNIQAKDEFQEPILEGSEKTIRASVRGFWISSVQWIGPHGNISTSNGKYEIKYCRNTRISTLQISAFEINDSGLYSCHAKGVCGPSAQDSVRISVNDATDPNTCATDANTYTTNHKAFASKLILGLVFGIICVAYIFGIMILVMIGKPCALKLGLGFGLGLGIPFVGCIIVIVILVKNKISEMVSVLRNVGSEFSCIPKFTENRKIKSGKGEMDLGVEEELKELNGKNNA